MDIKSTIENLKSKIGSLSKSDGKKTSMAIDIGHFSSKLIIPYLKFKIEIFFNINLKFKWFIYLNI